MDFQELIQRIILQNGGIFIHGILLHASAKIRQNPKSKIEEVLVFHEFHRIGLDGLIKWTASYPIDSELITIKGDEVVQFPTAPIGTRVILKLQNFWDWNGDFCTNQAEPVFILQIGSESWELSEISQNTLKCDNI